MPIGVDDTRRGMVLLTQGFGQEALCRGRVLLGREEKVEGREKRRYQPTASRITSGSNWRHFDRVECNCHFSNTL
jgi:hypothetical protein